MTTGVKKDLMLGGKVTESGDYTILSVVLVGKEETALRINRPISEVAEHFGVSISDLPYTICDFKMVNQQPSIKSPNQTEWLPAELWTKAPK